MSYEERSFEELAEDYQPLIKKMVKVYSGGMRADEAFQLGLIALWEAQRTYEKERGHFPAFVKFHLRRKFLTHIRIKQRDADRYIYNEAVVETAAGTTTATDDFWTEMWVERQQKRLSKREYSWLYLTVMEQLNTSDIAEKFAVSPHTVRSWKKTAVKKLRQAFVH